MVDGLRDATRDITRDATRDATRDSMKGGLGSLGGLAPGQWTADPETGIVSLSKGALDAICSDDPVDKWYILDPEPLAK